MELKVVGSWVGSASKQGAGAGAQEVCGLRGLEANEPGLESALTPAPEAVAGRRL